MICFFFFFQLYLSIIDIPRNTNYSCVFDFGEKQVLTAVIHWNFGVSCKTPQIKSLGISFGPSGIFILYIKYMYDNSLFSEFICGAILAFSLTKTNIF